MRFLLAAIAALGVSTQALGEVQITGAISNSTANLYYEKYTSQGASASVFVVLGTFIRLGVTHRQELKEKAGYKVDKENQGQFFYFAERDHIVTNSLDLKLILYPGTTLVPYLSGGIAAKTYNTEYTIGESKVPTLLPDAETVNLKADPYTEIVPTVGIGLGIRLNQEFSLQLSYDGSPGTMMEPGGEKIGVIDTYMQFGLTYHL
jgi:hypothetical protein